MPIVQFDDALNETLEDEEAPLPANLRAAANIDTQIGTATQEALDLKLTTSTATVDAKYDPGATGVAAPYVSLRDRLRVTLDATSCKLLGDDSTDNQPELQNILDDIAGWGGGRFHLNSDRASSAIYRVGAAIDLPGDVYIFGDGANATTLKATGDFPVLQTIGVSGGVISRGGASNMLIRGGGKANANAHGVKIAWTNRQSFSRLRFHSCRNAFDFSNVWQVEANYLQIDGGGSDQNYNGFYGREVDPTNQNNTLLANLCTVQNAENIGYRLINFNGSRFTACEVAGAGSHGWHLGAPTTGTERVRWGHFSNIVSDTCVGDLMRIERGSATECHDFQINGLWLGTSSGGHGLHLIDADRLQIDGIMVRAAYKSAIYLEDGDDNVITSFMIEGFDSEATANAAIKVEDGLRNIIANGRLKSSGSSGAAILETGTSDDNDYDLEPNGHAITLVGTSSSFRASSGEYAFRYQRAGANHVGAITADNGREVYLGLGTQSSPLTHSIKRSTSNQLQMITNGGLRFDVGSGVGAGAGGFLNTNHQPMLDYTTTVASLPASPNGTRAWVTDATQTWPTDTGTTVTGGGANGVPVIRHGGAWKVA